MEAAAAANKEQPPFCNAGPGVAAAAALNGTRRGDGGEGCGLPGGARSQPAPRGGAGAAGAVWRRPTRQWQRWSLTPRRAEEPIRSESPGIARGARREMALLPLPPFVRGWPRS